MLKKYITPIIVTIVSGAALTVSGWYLNTLNATLTKNTISIQNLEKIVRHQNQILELVDIDPDNIIKIPEIKQSVIDIQNNLIEDEYSYEAIRRDLNIVLSMLGDAESQITRELTKTAVLDCVENNADSNSEAMIWINTKGPNVTQELLGAALGTKVKIALKSDPLKARYMTVAGHVLQELPVGDQIKVPDMSMNKAGRKAVGFSDNLGWATLYVEMFVSGADKHPLKSFSLYKEASKK